MKTDKQIVTGYSTIRTINICNFKAIIHFISALLLTHLFNGISAYQTLALGFMAYLAMH